MPSGKNLALKRWITQHKPEWNDIAQSWHEVFRKRSLRDFLLDNNIISPVDLEMILTQLPFDDPAENSFWDTLEKKYSVIDLMAQGGMGKIYKALDRNTEQVYAIKKLKLDDLEDSAQRKILQKFQCEGKIVSQMRHPNIVACNDYEICDDYSYICFEWVDGNNLEDFVRKYGVMSESQALKLLRAMAKAMIFYDQKLHVIHRDIKPSNIMLPFYGEPKLSDFGVAKVREISKDYNPATVGVGTPIYMSPEQALGHDIDIRSDLYSLGLVIYYAITGENPASGNLFAISKKFYNQEACVDFSKIPHIGENFQKLLSHMTRLDRNERIASPENLMNDSFFVDEWRIIDVQSGKYFSVQEEIWSMDYREGGNPLPLLLRKVFADFSVKCTEPDHVLVNDADIQPNVWVPLFDGDHVSFAGKTFRIEGPRE